MAQPVDGTQSVPVSVPTQSMGTRAKENGGLVVVSSHDQSLVDDLCDALLDLRTVQPAPVE